MFKNPLKQLRTSYVTRNLKKHLSNQHAMETQNKSWFVIVKVPIVPWRKLKLSTWSPAPISMSSLLSCTPLAMLGDCCSIATSRFSVRQSNPIFNWFYTYNINTSMIISVHYIAIQYQITIFVNLIIISHLLRNHRNQYGALSPWQLSDNLQPLSMWFLHTGVPFQFSSPSLQIRKTGSFSHETIITRVATFETVRYGTLKQYGFVGVCVGSRAS